MRTVIVHSKTGCVFCDKVKSFLETKGVVFTEVKHDDDEQRQALYDGFGLTGPTRTVPQVVIDGVRVGGFAELMGWVKRYGVPA